jgi:hypothetical protein
MIIYHVVKLIHSLSKSNKSVRTRHFASIAVHIVDIASSSFSLTVLVALQALLPSKIEIETSLGGWTKAVCRHCARMALD